MPAGWQVTFPQPQVRLNEEELRRLDDLGNRSAAPYLLGYFASIVPRVFDGALDSFEKHLADVAAHVEAQRAGPPCPECGAVPPGHGLGCPRHEVPAAAAAGGA